MNEATQQQPTPKGTGPDITPLVIADMLARSAEGVKKYGEPLRAFNGRRALVDAYQESVDQTKYLRQALEERGQLLEMDEEEGRIRRHATSSTDWAWIEHLLGVIDRLRSAL
jgi:hypothetical protein